MITLHLKTNIDLRPAEDVKVVFYRENKEVLVKSGAAITVKQSEVETDVFGFEMIAWNPSRYIAIEVHAVMDGTPLVSNVAYRTIEANKVKREYTMNTWFGDARPHHSDVVDTSDATLDSGIRMLAPYTAYARGEKITGSMPLYDGSFIPILESIGFDLLPDKMTYNDGETIDLTGAIVNAYYKSGAKWEGNAAYPGGIIPISELSIDPITADVTKRSAVIYTNSRGINAIRCVMDEPGASYWSGITYYYYNGDLGGGHTICNMTQTPLGGDIYLTKFNGNIYAACVTGESYCNGSVRDASGIAHTLYSSSEATGHGVFRYMKDLTDFIGEQAANIPESYVGPTGETIDELHMEGGTQSIDVSWERIGDHEQLSADLEINVEE